jgi:hypothetical protein
MNDMITIQSKIYEIRGQRVMLDFDLAALFSTETRLLKRAVRRNMERFPSDFMFELTKEEANYLLSNRVSQNGTPLYNYSAYAPFAFTEQGVAMLSSVLKSDVAIQVNITIMRAFVALRKMIYLPNTEGRLTKIEHELEIIKNNLNESLADQNDINEDTRAQLDAISLALAELQAKEPVKKERKPIGFIQPKED